MHGERPVADARIVTPDVGGRELGRSDVDGRFVVEVSRYVGTTRETIAAEQPALALRGELALDLAPGQQVDDLTLAVGTGMVVLGTIVDASGRPVKDARGTIARRWPRGRSDPAGRFWLVTHRVGTHRLEVLRDGDELPPAPGHVMPRIDVELDGRRQGVVVVFDAREPLVTGVVVDERGAPTPAELRLDDAAPLPTDTGGRFALMKYGRDDDVLTVQAADGRLARVVIGDRERGPLRVVVAVPASLRVPCGRMDGWWFELVPEGDRFGRTIRCDEVVPELAPGRALVHASQAQRDALATVELVSGRLAEPTLAPAPRHPLAVRVVDLVTGAPRSDDVGCEVRYRGLDRGERLEPTSRSPDAVHRGFAAAWPVELSCRGGRIVADEPRLDLDRVPAPAVIELVAVPRELGAIELGATFAADPAGARVTAVADEVAPAGVAVGDILLAVDGVPVAGRSLALVEELAVRVPRGRTVTWRVRRGGRVLTVRIAAPRV
jgi:hypothetical protein